MCNEEKEETELILKIPNSIQNLYQRVIYLIKKGEQS